MVSEKRFTLIYNNYLGTYISIFFPAKRKTKNSNPHILLDRIKFFIKKKALHKYGQSRNFQFIERKKLNKDHPIQALCNLLNSYFSGKKIDFSTQITKIGCDLPIEKEFTTNFSQKVISYLKDKVKYGKLISYSEIGKAINSKAYRAIGSIIKRNPYPIVIPCHR
ncbi:MAG: methylated-DNA--[protein]-cysteine S-methyltransferase, partial [Promethearchaeia archaeon]